MNGGVNEGVRKEIVELVAILINSAGLKVHDLVEKRGKSRATIERYLKLARLFGITEFKGSPRTGGYYITNLLRDSIENKKRE